MAKNQQTDPLEVLENLKGFLEQIEQQDQNKADAFKQAIMILSAPNSIAVSSNEDLYLSADGQISQSAGESSNLSTQKSLIAHASEKISLFAAQDGLRAYAGKGKVEIQAQGDALDVIARKGIQIISTEEQIEIKANKKIVLTAGGSQIEISGAGVLPTTAGKFEVKAGQHQFLGGSKVNMSLPILKEPVFAEVKKFSHRLDFSSLGLHSDYLKSSYRVRKKDGIYLEGVLDERGRTNRIYSEVAEPLEVFIDIDEPVIGYIENETDSKE